MKSSLSVGLSVLLLAFTFTATAANWPAWRGPHGTGISTEQNLPLKWNTHENVRWRVELPGRGNSSPIVWGDRVFVTQAVNGENRRTVMCFDRATGKLLWQSGVTYTEKEPTQRDNPYCAATPVTDGERVIASFGSAGLYCYDFQGKELWHRDFGKMNHMFGNASSPVLHGDLCVFPFGPDEKARLIAVNTRTGETVWEIQPPKVDPSELPTNRFGMGNSGSRGSSALGTPITPQMFTLADRNTDQKLTRAEFVAVADVWFDRIDTAKTGKLSPEQLSEKFYDALAPANETAPAAERRGPSRTTAPAFFNAADIDKDGTLTRDELKTTLGKWFAQWDPDKTDALSQEKLRDGLNAVLIRPNTSTSSRAGAERTPSGQSGPAGGRSGSSAGGPGGSWSTPLIIQANGRDELIMNFPHRLAAYDPKTGQPLWLSKGLGMTIYTTPVWGEGLLFAMTSGPAGGAAIAVKPGGSGDVTESQRVWRLDRAKSGIGSGVIHQGHLYTISQDGIAVCLDLKNGRTVWEERLKGPTSRNTSWSSMLLADGKIYVPNQSGDVFVLRASPKFEVLATNSVGEPTNASLAVADGAIFLRTDKALWCLAEKAQ